MEKSNSFSLESVFNSFQFSVVEPSLNLEKKTFPNAPRYYKFLFLLKNYKLPKMTLLRVSSDLDHPNVQSESFFYKGLKKLDMSTSD